MSYTLRMYERVTRSTSAYIWDLTKLAPDWSRTIRARGGFFQGDFTISAEAMHLTNLVGIFNNAIGRRIVETTGSITTWEGEIVYMRLQLGDITYERTLDADRWHNRVKVQWGGGETEWEEEATSVGSYGESELIVQGSAAYDAAAAEGYRTKLIARDAWPRSWASDGLSTAQGPQQPPALYVQCAGYVFSMNRRYRETNIAAANISTQVSTLVGLSEFVSAGVINTNTTQAAVILSGTPMRLWDAIVELIEMGDDPGNEWVGGVYADRKFNYQAAETAITHEWRGGRLYQKGGADVQPTMLRPNIIVHLADVPAIATARSVLLDDPRNVYIDEVEFAAPDQFTLVPRVPTPTARTLNNLTRRVIGFADKYSAFRAVVSAFSNLPGLRGLWTMAEYDTSGNAEDRTNNDLLLTRNGATQYNYSGLVPFFYFDGSAAYLSRTDEAATSVTGGETYINTASRGLTLGAWVQCTDDTAQQALIGKWGGAGNRSYKLTLHGNVAGDPARLEISDDGTNSDTVDTSGGYTASRWHFIVGRFNDNDTGEELAIFLDAVKTTDTTARASIFDGTAAFTIGALAGGSLLLTGRVAISFLCASALPDDMIGALFQQSRALFGV